MLTLAVNVGAFQLGWVACVFGAASGRPWLGPLAAIPVVGVHLWQSSDRWGALRKVLLLGGLGAGLDSALGYAGIFLYRDSLLTPWFCPPWLVALWLIFATTLRQSLGWLAARDGLAALLGGIFGPASYYAGGALGALGFGVAHARALAVVGALWALLLPLLLRLASNWSGEAGIRSH